MSIRIGLGGGGFVFEDLDDYWKWIQYCEESGVDSLWQSDRLISKQPQLESLSVMAALAGATKRIKFGMNAIVVGYRDPLVLAKQCATIDYISGGRLLPVLGVGAPWNPEWNATGRLTKGRGVRANEVIEIVSRLWTEDDVSFEGKFFTYKNASISPKPKQNPLPLWIGGNSEAAIKRTARIGTGWLGGLCTPTITDKVISSIKVAVKENGRSIDDDHYGVTVPFRFGSLDDAPAKMLIDNIMKRRPEGFDPNESIAVGDAKAVAALLQKHVAAGASKFVLLPMVASGKELMEQTRRLVEEVAPMVEDRVRKAVPA
jgi:probable F420-dependent oxidoreductase